MRFYALALPLAVLVLGGASLMVMQPAFSLFGQAYGVAVDAAVPDEPSTPTPAAAPRIFAVTEPTAAAKERADATAMPSATSTTRATQIASAIATATAVLSTPTETAIPTRTATATLTRTATSSAAGATTTATLTASPTATACPYLGVALVVDPADQRIILDGVAKVQVAIRNEARVASPWSFLRLTLPPGLTVSEVHLAETSLTPVAKGSLDYRLPSLAAGAALELVLVVERLADTAATAARAAEAALRFEVLTASCTAREEVRAKGSIVLTQPVKPAPVTPVAVDTVKPSEAKSGVATLKEAAVP
jgi:hypothetical protein